MDFNMNHLHRLHLANKLLRLNRLGQQFLFILWLTQCGNKAQEHQQQQQHLHQNTGVDLAAAAAAGGGGEEHQDHYPVNVNVIKENLRLQLQWTTNQDDINRTSGSTSSGTNRSWISLSGGGSGSAKTRANVVGNNDVGASSSLRNGSINVHVKNINNTLSLNHRNATSAARSRLQDLNHKSHEDKIQHDNKAEAGDKNVDGKGFAATDSTLMQLFTPQNLPNCSATTRGPSSRQHAVVGNNSIIISSNSNSNKYLVSLENTTISNDNASNTRIASDIINPFEKTTKFKKLVKYKKAPGHVIAIETTANPRIFGSQLGAHFLPIQQQIFVAVPLAAISNASNKDVASSTTSLLTLPGKSGADTMKIRQRHQPQTVRANDIKKEADGKVKPLSSSNSSMSHILNNNYVNENGIKVENQPRLPINKGLFLKTPKDLHNKQLNAENEKLIEDFNQQPKNNNYKIFTFITTKQQRKADNAAKLSQTNATLGYKGLKAASLNTNLKLKGLPLPSENIQSIEKAVDNLSYTHESENELSIKRQNFFKPGIEKQVQTFAPPLSDKILSSNKVNDKSADLTMTNDLKSLKTSETISEPQHFKSFESIENFRKNKFIQSPAIQSNDMLNEKSSLKANKYIPAGKAPLLFAPIKVYTKKLASPSKAFETHDKVKKIVSPKPAKLLPKITQAYLKLARKLDTTLTLNTSMPKKYLSLEEPDRSSRVSTKQNAQASALLPGNVYQTLFKETQIEEISHSPLNSINLTIVPKGISNSAAKNKPNLKKGEVFTKPIKPDDVKYPQENKDKENPFRTQTTLSPKSTSLAADFHEFNPNIFKRNKRLNLKNFKETTGIIPPPVFLNISIIPNANSSTNTSHATDKHHNSQAMNETKAYVTSINKSETINKSVMREKHDNDEGNSTNVLKSNPTQGHQKGYVNSTMPTPDNQNEIDANITFNRMVSTEINVMNSKQLDDNLLKDMDNKWLIATEYQNADGDKRNNDNAEPHKKDKSPTTNNFGVSNKTKDNVFSTASPATAVSTSSANTTLATGGVPTTKNNDANKTEMSELWELPTTLRTTAATAATTLPTFTGITIKPQEIYEPTTTNAQDFEETTFSEILQEAITNNSSGTFASTTPTSSATVSISSLPEPILSTSLRDPFTSTTPPLSSLSKIQEFLSTRLTTINYFTTEPVNTRTPSLMQLATSTSTLSSMLSSSEGFPSASSPLTSVSTTSYSYPYLGNSFSTTTTTTSSTPLWPVKHASVMEGNVILGGLMMVHSREDSITCGPIMPQGGIQALEAMLYTLDQVNKQQLLPNITLGAHILDDCDKDTYGLEMAVDFIKGKRVYLFYLLPLELSAFWQTDTSCLWQYIIIFI